MKASIKFRDEQKPLVRAKIPLNILGFPFQSGIVAGESKELSLNLTTFFESGPSLKLAYRPNDVANPFSLVFKTGIGHFGSPISSSFNMSAEFNLITVNQTQTQNPRFFVHFKPRFGDFTVKKTQSSAFRSEINGNKPVSDSISVSISPSDEDLSDPPVVVDFFKSGNRSTDSLYAPAAGLANRVFSDVDLTATTAVPLRKNASLNFRWGIRLPATEDTAMVLMKKSSKSTAGISFQKLPVLLFDKIGIEHVASADCRGLKNVGPVGSDVAEAIFGVAKQLEIVQAENGALRKAMEKLSSDFSAVKSGSNAVKVNGFKDFGGKDMEDELVIDE